MSRSCKAEHVTSGADAATASVSELSSLEDLFTPQQMYTKTQEVTTSEKTKTQKPISGDSGAETMNQLSD